MTNSFNQQTTGVVFWDASNKTYNVQSPLGKTVIGTPVHNCDNFDCDDKISPIHWHCLTKLIGFLQNTIYDQT